MAKVRLKAYQFEAYITGTSKFGIAGLAIVSFAFVTIQEPSNGFNYGIINLALLLACLYCIHRQELIKKV